MTELILLWQNLKSQVKHIRYNFLHLKTCLLAESQLLKYRKNYTAINVLLEINIWVFLLVLYTHLHKKPRLLYGFHRMCRCHHFPLSCDLCLSCLIWVTNKNGTKKIWCQWLIFILQEWFLKVPWALFNLKPFCRVHIATALQSWMKIDIFSIYRCKKLGHKEWRWLTRA